MQGAAGAWDTTTALPQVDGKSLVGSASMERAQFAAIRWEQKILLRVHTCHNTMPVTLASEFVSLDGVLKDYRWCEIADSTLDAFTSQGPTLYILIGREALSSLMVTRGSSLISYFGFEIAYAEGQRVAAIWCAL